MSEHFSDSAAGFASFVTPDFVAPSVTHSDSELQRKFAEQQKAWQPRTKLGQRLKELREQFVAAGGQLLTEEQFERELQERRGTLHSEN